MSDTSLTAITVDPNNPAYISVAGVLLNQSQTTLIEYPAGKVGTSYMIPASVTSIGDSAFDFSPLTSITIGNNVISIGEQAFELCYSLTNVTIPASVSSIGTGAFEDCTSLTSVYFGGNAPSADSTVFSDDTGTVYYLPGTKGWYSPFGGLPAVLLASSGAPVIVAAPASQTNAVGTAATFNVSANSDLPLSYQWQFNSNSIAGATNTTLTLTNVQLWQSGYYDVVVTNAFGAANAQALLHVLITFTNTDIGDPGAPGAFTNSNGSYTVRGSGEGTDGSADVFNFTYQALAGDAQIVARLLSLQGGDPQLAEAGVMIRESLDPSSEQVSLSANASTNVIFSRRLATPGKSIPNSFQATNYLHGTNYIWLRLMRMGNTFVAHCSTNGLDWQYMWFTTVAMSNQVQVGLGVTAHFNGELATATFDNVSIGSLTNLGTWPLSEPVVLLGGQNWSPAEFQRLGGFEFLLGGVVGDYFSIKCSTNITTPVASWSQLANLTNTYGVLPFVDPQALTNPVRFYRVQRSAQAFQAFHNLDFESASLALIPPGQFGGFVPISDALPGWTGYIGTNQVTTVLQNNYTLGNASIDIFGPDWGRYEGGIIEGQYTLALLQGVDPQSMGWPVQFVSASISQSGLVPGNAQSLQFKAQTFSQTNFVVSLGGKALSLVPIGSGTTYTLYGADVSAFAGQFETLTITALPGPNIQPYLFDSIVFSP